VCSAVTYGTKFGQNPRLRDAENTMILVLDQYWRVTDGETDTVTSPIATSRTCIAGARQKLIFKILIDYSHY